MGVTAGIKIVYDDVASITNTPFNKRIGGCCCEQDDCTIAKCRDILARDRKIDCQEASIRYVMFLPLLARECSSSWQILLIVYRFTTKTYKQSFAVQIYPPAKWLLCSIANYSIRNNFSSQKVLWSGAHLFQSTLPQKLKSPISIVPSIILFAPSTLHFLACSRHGYYRFWQP